MHGFRITAGTTGALLAVLAAAGVLAGYMAAQESAPEPGMRIIEQDRDHLVIEYVPKIQQEFMAVNGRTYLSLTCEGATYPAEPGVPMVPERAALIGIPAGSQPAVTVVDVREGATLAGRLLPAPGLASEDGDPLQVHVENPDAYRSADTFVAAGIGVAGLLRQQPVASIRFSPVRYAPQSDRIQLLEKITVRVNFQPAGLGRTSTQAAVSEPLFEPVYAGLLNAGQAGAWRVGPSADVLRKASVLESGPWYRILVTDEGPARITGDILKDAGIDINVVAPQTIRLLHGGERALPADPNAPRSDGLLEVPVIVTGESDGRLDGSDAVLFYGRPASGWEPVAGGGYRHYIHPYQEAGVYWLTWGGAAGQRMSARASAGGAATVTPQSFRARLFLEMEREKLHESGLDWYGDVLFDGESRTIAADLPGYVDGSPVSYRIQLKGGGSGVHQITVSEGTTSIFSSQFFSYDAPVLNGTAAVNLSSDRSNLHFAYTTTSQAGRAYIDWIEYEYDREFRAEDNRLFFESPSTAGTVGYAINNLDRGDVRIFDVTNPLAPVEITGHTRSGGATRLNDPAPVSGVRQYWAAAEAAMKAPAAIQKAENSDLRSRPRTADLVIITHEDFYAEMLRLQAHRRNVSGIETEVVKISSIYDEFSGGLMDAVAIRDFLKFAYEHWNRPPAYVLLAGDGDYDFKNVLSNDDKNWIPPYQIDHDNELVTRCTDDYYTYVDGNDEFMDMAIGRIPVRSVQEARNYVDKLIRYETRPEFGNWKSTMTLAADDELTPGDNLQRIHTDQSETIALASYLPASLNQRKIYLMDYPEVRLSNVTGVRKPGAENDFVESMNSGTAIISYFGHGNHRLLSHEQLLSQDEDFARIQNGLRLFFFYPATCAFGRFDMPLVEGMAEGLIKAANRGAVATLNSVRDVFARQNFALADNFYRQLFTETPTMRLGAALVAAKAQVVANSVNNEKFHLFGDPSMRLALPALQAAGIGLNTDSLAALSQSRVQGTLTRSGGAPWNDFTGTVHVQVFDDERTGVRVMENNERVTYRLPGRAIFRGTTTVTPAQNGQFDIGFIVPKDITYGGRNGRISVYYTGHGADGNGSLDKIAIGGTAPSGDDQQGPGIQLSFDGWAPDAQDIIDTSPVMTVEIEDASGINITGEIGHKIELTLDDRESERVDLSDRFNYDADSFTRGSLQHEFAPMDPGMHEVTVKAWDNYNNSSTATMEFSIVEDARLAITEMYNYPNPFSGDTQFTFAVNQPADVRIKVYTVNGRLVREFEDIRVDPAGTYVSEMWNGRDQDDDLMANGVYLYKVIAQSLIGDGTATAEKTGKLVIAR